MATTVSKPTFNLIDGTMIATWEAQAYQGMIFLPGKVFFLIPTSSRNQCEQAAGLGGSGLAFCRAGLKTIVISSLLMGGHTRLGSTAMPDGIRRQLRAQFLPFPYSQEVSSTGVQAANKATRS